MKITSTAQILVNTMNAPPYTYDDLEYPPSNLDCYFGQFDGQLGDLRKIATHKAHDDYVVDAHPDGSIAYVDGDQMVYQREGKKSKVPWQRIWERPSSTKVGRRLLYRTGKPSLFG